MLLYPIHPAFCARTQLDNELCQLVCDVFLCVWRINTFVVHYTYIQILSTR